MDIPTVAVVILRIVFVVVGLGLLVVLWKLVQILGKVNTTVDEVKGQLAPTLENVEKLTNEAVPLLENVNARVEELNPMMDRVNLTVDALNLELMRVDGILENVGDITDDLAKVSAAAETLTNAPLKMVDDASGMVRRAMKHRKASDESMALGENKSQGQIGASREAANEKTPAAAPRHQKEQGDESPVSQAFADALTGE